MKIAYITSGAAGMYCGSCMKDNTLVAALNRLGNDALLLPTYTPITTDEEDVSQSRVFLGGINVYLQQKSWLFRHTPRLVDWLLDLPRLLRWVGRFAVRTSYSKLGPLTESMLLGTHGKQAKEIDRLADWLASEFKPDVVILTNALISGLVPAIRAKCAVPVWGTLQGDDIFLDGLPEKDRRRAIELIGKNAEQVEGWFATSHYYADHMAGYLGLPRERMRVVHPGLNLAGHGGPPPPRTDDAFTVGYFARICPEKGLHQLVDAYVHLRKQPGAPRCRMRIGGWLGIDQHSYLKEQMSKVSAAGLGDEVEHLDCPAHADKVRFLQSLDVLSVPTTYREPKGLYVLEAMANGVPVVQPRHGSFPELVEATGGGLLVEPDDPIALAAGLRRMIDEPDLRRRSGEAGKAAVRSRFTAEEMARQTLRHLNATEKAGFS